MSDEARASIADVLRDHKLGRQAAALQADLELFWPGIERDLVGELTNMAGSNGRLPGTDLKQIPGGFLRKDAADAWIDQRNYIGNRHGVWITPTGPNSSYRKYAAQQYFWDLYRSGRGNVAAFPGTSNHGWGLAVDVATPQMAYYIRLYGSRFGWSWAEGQRVGEWWHFTYVGGYTAKRPPALPKALNRKERGYAKKLIAHRHERAVQAATGKGAKWRSNNHWAKHYDRKLRRQLKKIGKGNRFGRPARRKAIQRVIDGDFNY